MARIEQQQSFFRRVINSILVAIIAFVIAAWLRHKAVDWSRVMGIATGTVIVEAWIWWRKKEKDTASPLNRAEP